jgi:hypothetical protein
VIAQVQNTQTRKYTFHRHASNLSVIDAVTQFAKRP